MSDTNAAPGALEQAAEQVSKEAKRSKRGFASMRPERVRELSRKGGLAAHRAGNAHEFTREEAREAGRKGGRATQAKLREANQQPRS